MRRRGRPLVIPWQDEADALYARYRQESKPDLRPRWHALWLLRTGTTVARGGAVLGVHERSVQHWVAWYRAGGIGGVAAHRKAGKGTRARLTPAQQAAVVAEAATGRFRTAAEVVTWVAGAVRRRLHRLGDASIVTAPALHAESAPSPGREGRSGGAGSVEKGGCGEALRQAGVTAETALAWADEMRLGLHGRVRRVWAPRGVKVRQRVQLRYEWRSLALAVEVTTGRLWWQWTTSMRKEAIAPVVAAWQAAGVAALVWDGAPAHRARLVRDVGVTLVTQPPRRRN